MNTIKKAVVALVATTGLMAGEYVPVIITDNPVSNEYVRMAEVSSFKGDKGDTGATGAQGEQGIKGDTGATGENGSDGVDGTNGTNGSDADATDLYNQLKASSTAIASVELNPDHEGLSIGIGATTSGYNAGAVGIMYGVKTDNLSVGFNVKAYKVEGGHEGIGAGITVGF